MSVAVKPSSTHSGKRAARSDECDMHRTTAVSKYPLMNEFGITDRSWFAYCDAHSIEEFARARLSFGLWIVVCAYSICIGFDRALCVLSETGVTDIFS